MNHLLFKVKSASKYIHYILVGADTIHLVDSDKYRLLDSSDVQEVLNKSEQIAKDEIAQLKTSRRQSYVEIIDHAENVLLRVDFISIAMRKEFIQAFPKFKLERDKTKKRVNLILAIVLMFFTASFFWAGTVNPDHISSKGIRNRWVHVTMELHEYLNAQIGQKGILSLGFVLLGIFLYLIFKPEVWQILRREIHYTNPRI